MFESRFAHTSLTGSSMTANVVGGCPQGGVLSPLLLNLVIDRRLTVTNDLGFSTIGFAEDIVITVHDKFAHTIREIMQEALNVVFKWAIKEGLNINPHKTAIVSFNNSRKIVGLGPLILHGKEPRTLDEVKYLGVMLDSKLNWKQHLKKTIRKAQTTFAAVKRTCGKNGVSDLIWYTVCILRLSDHPYFIVP
jgi:hypothetical protein